MAGSRGQARINLSLAISDYEHTRDLATGAVAAEGLDLNIQHFTIQEIFHRFTRFREWDVSEMSMGMYVSLLSSGDDSLTAIPVFPSRMFRLSSFFVRSDGPVQAPADLRGRKVGYPDWAHTAGIYARGWLTHQVGVKLDEIEWVQAGVNEAGRTENLSFPLPAGIRRTTRPDSSLDAMLLSGELDAVNTSHPVQSFTAGDPRVRRLVPDVQAAEEQYFRDTGIFPIMHVVAIRREIHQRHPWVAMNLYAAFEAAKSRALQRMADSTISRYPFPWASAMAERARGLFGRDFWPYGIEANRVTLEAFLRMCLEQGVARRPVTLDEMFPAEVRSTFKV